MNAINNAPIPARIVAATCTVNHTGVNTIDATKKITPKITFNEFFMWYNLIVNKFLTIRLINSSTVWTEEKRTEVLISIDKLIHHTHMHHRMFHV